MQARADAGYTRKEVSELTKGLVRERTLFDWERETAFPRLGPPLRALAEVIDTTLAWILRGDASARPGASSRSNDPGD